MFHVVLTASSASMTDLGPTPKPIRSPASPNTLENVLSTVTWSYSLCEVDVAGRLGVVDVGLVEYDQRMRCGLDYPPHVGLGHPRARWAVRIRHEHDAGIGLDRLDVGVDVDRHRRPIGRVVSQHGDAALGLSEEVVDREARSWHQDLPARFAKRSDEQRDDLGLTGAADHLFGPVGVGGRDLLS